MRQTTCALIACVALAGCGGPQEPPPKAGPVPMVKAPVIKPATIRAPTAEIGADIVATATIANLDSLLKLGSGYIAAHLPPAFQPMAQPDALRAALFKAMRADELATILDTSRPVALALADATVYRGGALGSALVALPVKDGPALASLFGRRSDKHETTPWKDHVFTAASGAQLQLRLEGEWALLASHEKLLHGAAAQLLPLVRGRTLSAAFSGELRMALVGERYSRELDRAAAKLRRKGARGRSLGDLGVARRLERWLSMARGMQTARLQLELEARSARLRLSATAKSAGPFQSYLATLAAGELWGVKYVPKESALVVAARESEASRLSDIEDGLQLLALVARDLADVNLVDEKALSGLRDALQASVKHLGQESALGLWVTGNGGVGLGGAVRVKDAAAAQAALTKAMKVLGKDLGRVVEKAMMARFYTAIVGVDPAQRAKLEAQAKREIPVVALRVRAGGHRAAGVAVDLYELSVGWPKQKSKDAQRRYDEVKKGIAKVTGLPLTVACACAGDAGLLAAGKDWKKRIAELVAVAKGGAGSKALERELATLAAGKRMTFAVWSGLASLVEGGMRVADQLTTVPADVRDTVNKLLPGPGKDVPVSALVYRDGDTLTCELAASSDLFGVLTKATLAMFSMRLGGGGPVPAPAPPVP